MADELDYEPETVENESRDHAMVEVVAEGEPELMLAHLEKKASLAGRMRTAIETVLVSQTYPGDWTVQGDKACLSSAGAERVGRSFPVQYQDVKWEKEAFTDTHGEGYRYVYMGYAELYGRRVFVHGSYGTRDKFLGFANNQWRPLEDINENHIRNAAYHIFCGNAIKELLGLRGMPGTEYSRIMGSTGRDAGQSSTVQRGKGTQGGSQASGDEHAHQKELADTCISFANAGMEVAQDGEGKWYLTPIGEDDQRSSIAIAADICVGLSSFEGKDGPVAGKGARGLTKKWLNATLNKARELAEQLEAMHSGD